VTTGEGLQLISRARLPASYEAAKQALATCERIDECKDWADKAAALASYARQSKDTELEKMAMRVRARAYRRCGELLQQIESAKGGDRGNQHTGGRSGNAPSRSNAAADAGLSKRQKDTALQVASIAKPTFDRLVDDAAPPTIAELAARGTKARPVEDHLEGRDPKDFKAATGALGAVKRFAAYTRSADHEAICRGLDDTERARISRHAKEGASWLAKFIARIDRGS
jgi:hypothetical protein